MTHLKSSFVALLLVGACGPGSNNDVSRADDVGVETQASGVEADSGVDVTACGNGVVDEGESCDVAIPVPQEGCCAFVDVCVDGDPCTVDRVANDGTCTADCDFSLAVSASGEVADQCCPAGASATDDADCTDGAGGAGGTGGSSGIGGAAGEPGIECTADDDCASYCLLQETPDGTASSVARDVTCVDSRCTPGEIDVCGLLSSRWRTCQGGRAFTVASECVDNDGQNARCDRRVERDITVCGDDEGCSIFEENGSVESACVASGQRCQNDFDCNPSSARFCHRIGSGAGERDTIAGPYACFEGSCEPFAPRVLEQCDPIRFGGCRDNHTVVYTGSCVLDGDERACVTGVLRSSRCPEGTRCSNQLGLSCIPTGAMP